MSTFLGRESFAGVSVDAAAAAVTFVGQAHFSGCIAFCNWPRADVEALLPPALRLAENRSPTPDVHPVVFIFGEHTQGATMFGGMTLPMGIHYFESAVAIPFVTHDGGAQLHTYIPRMYSSYFPAVWHGNTYYGFGKQLAKMWWQGPIFLATTDGDALLLHAAVETSEPWSQGACDHPHFTGLRDIFALPMVGRRSDGTFVCSYWGWDFEAASVRLVDSCVSIDAPLFDGLTPHRCYDVPAGTFEVRDMVWRLSWPGTCRY